MRRARLILLVTSVMLAIGVWEIGLRNIGGVFHDTFMRLDLERGWSLKPGFAGWMKGERVMWMRINADGMRDRDHALAAAPRTLRVAVLGDSYMQGINVPVEQTFAAFLESRLRGCLAPSGVTPEVLNFGVSGYGTAQELITYRVHAAKYRPDIVILAMYTSNDISDNSQVLTGESVPERPYYVIDNGELVLDDTFRAEIIKAEQRPWWRNARIFVTDHLRTAQLAYEGWNLLRPMLFDPPEEHSESTEGEESFDSVYQLPSAPENVKAWQVTEALMLRLAEDVRTNGAEPWIVTLASSDELELDPDTRRASLAELHVDDFSYPDRRIAAFGRNNHIGVVSLAEPMLAIAREQRIQMHGGYSAEVPLGGGHWNEVGNRVGAELTGDRLCAESAAIARAH